jgi:hypothetical protein
MSQRGSFVTEYLDCRQCYESCREILCAKEKYLYGVEVCPGTEEGMAAPIIAGKIGGLYGTEEIIAMETEIGPRISGAIAGRPECEGHTVRVAVLAEAGHPPHVSDSAVFLISASGVKVIR